MSDTNQTYRIQEANLKCFYPRYIKLHKSGELKKRGEELWNLMKRCQLCPRNCLKNRLEGNTGTCKAPMKLMISSFNPHFGEEAPLSGYHGSGTIFFTHCNLRCAFCINWDISLGGAGQKKTIAELAGMMLHLQDIGCHNINVVTPTHYTPHILLALDQAAGEKLHIPLVWNTSGYERLDILKLLEDIVDIYLPDFKYFDGMMAGKYSSEAYDYPQVTMAALLEMNRQVGAAKPGSKGIMQKGLMIRHLVLPDNVSGSDRVIKWIADNLPKDTYLNIMSQYRPMYNACDYPEINRTLYRREYEEIVNLALQAGLTNLEIQGY